MKAHYKRFLRLLNLFLTFKANMNKKMGLILRPINNSV